MGYRRLHSMDAPKVYTDGERSVIVLDDSHRPRSLHHQNPLGKDESLRFSVNRGGGFSFAKKKVVTPQFEAQPRLDGEGNEIPNANHTIQTERYGYSHEPKVEMENVLLEEPKIRLGYDVDRDWWARNAYTSVKFGNGK